MKDKNVWHALRPHEDNTPDGLNRMELIKMLRNNKLHLREAAEIKLLTAAPKYLLKRQVKYEEQS